MQMGAITDHYGLEAIRRALEVGVDARFGNNLQYDEEIVPRVIKIKQRPGEAGVISEQRIDQFWRRIMRLKNLTAAP